MTSYEVRKHLRDAQGELIEILTRKSEKICGKLCWLSPDQTMAEIYVKDGQIKTVTDVNIKDIRKI